METITTQTEKEIWQWPVSGLSPILFTIDDLCDSEEYSQEEAWDLLKEGYPNLEKANFVDKVHKFWKYWLVSAGFADYASVILYGKKGKGKSLGQAWLCLKGAQEFGKRITTDWPPPIHRKDAQGNLLCPPELRNATILLDDHYRIKIRDELNRLAVYQKMHGVLPPKEELEKLIIYNAWWGFDESQTWASKSRTYNFTILVAIIDSIARHLHTSMFFTFVDPAQINPLFNPYTTHLIQCDKDMDIEGACTYTIWHKRDGVTKKLHLFPEDWKDIWDTNYIPQVTHQFYISLGGKGKDRQGISLESLADIKSGGKDNAESNS